MSDSLVIIPTYNEKENIEKLVRTIFSLNKSFHVLIVDDGSPDGTAQIVKELQKALNTDDVACVIDAKHLCVNSRGIKDVSSSTVTSEFGGKFKFDSSTKEEFLKYIQLDTSFNGI